MPSKIALIRIWSQPPISSSVARLLRENFPEYELEIFELGEIVRSRPGIVLINLLHVFWLYGFGILSGRRELKACFWRTPYIFKRIRKLISELISIEEYTFSFQLYSICDAHLDGLPHYLYMDHTHLENLNYPSFDRRLLYAPRWIQLERTIYQNATRIFTRSSNIVRSLVEQYGCPPEKVARVYVGSNIQPSEGEPENDGYANKNILFVGLDWERKGGPELVRAFRKVLQAHPDARLTVVGCSPTIDVPNSDIVGRVPVEQMSNYFRQASVFCLPTRREPFGVVFIEAFSHKLPVVATRIGAIPDFVIDGETGHLVRVGDVDALAQALTELVADPSKCRAFGMAGYQLVKAHYNWENVGELIRENVLAYIRDSSNENSEEYNMSELCFLGVLHGSIEDKGEAIKYGHFFRALSRQYTVINIFDARLRWLARLVNLFRAFRFNYSEWRERSYKNLGAFQARSKRIANYLNSFEREIDVIIQVGVLFDASWKASSVPTIIYTDYTAQMSAENPEAGRSPFTPSERERWFDLEGNAYAKSLHVFTRSEMVRRSIIEHYNVIPSKVSVIGGGVNFPDLPEVPNRMGREKLTVLFIGKDFYRKGGGLVLDAFSRVHRQIPSSRLVCVTDVFPRMHKNISGVKWVHQTYNRAKIKEIYRNANIFVLPSRLETWGGVVLEAMAFGLPCVGVRGQPMEEIIVDGKTGYLVPPEDINALSHVMLRLLKNEDLREQMGYAGRRRIEAHYTWDQVVSNLSGVLKDTRFHGV